MGFKLGNVLDTIESVSDTVTQVGEGIGQVYSSFNQGGQSQPAQPQASSGQMQYNGVAYTINDYYSAMNKSANAGGQGASLTQAEAAALRGMGGAPVYEMGMPSANTGVNTGIQQTGLFSSIGESLGITQPAPNVPATLANGGAAVPWWRGPDGKLQMPWNDPRVPQFLQQFSLDDSYLRVYYRAPKGYVIIRDASGKPYAVLRKIAQQFGLWKPSARPPISATEWKHYKANKRIEKKLVKIARPALRKHSTRTVVVKKK